MKILKIPKSVLLALSVLIVLGLTTGCPGVSSGDANFIPMENTLIYVEGGTFTMGSPDTEYTRKAIEGPQHEVSISSFHMQKYEVSHWDYIEFLNDAGVDSTGNLNGNQVVVLEYKINETMADSIVYSNGAYRFKAIFWASNANIPVGVVPWYGAVEYANWMSEQNSLDKVYTVSQGSVTVNWNANGYRLPTEAEWEYAARGGTMATGYKLFAGSDDLDKVAWYSLNSENTAHTPGGKAPNELGIYDMSGNMYEWCWDRYANYSSDSQLNPIGPSYGSYRIVRGGSYASGNPIDDPGTLRNAFRTRFTPEDTGNLIGFRLVAKSERGGNSSGTTFMSGSFNYEGISIIVGESGNTSPEWEDSPNDMIVSYSIDPALPSGISFNETTGEITADTTASVQAETNYTITATATGNYTGSINTTTQIVIIDHDGSMSLATDFVLVKGATFTMGSPDSETDRDDDEGPQHEVTISDFYMSKYEITQIQYKNIMETNPSWVNRYTRPVNNVSWFDAVVFCNSLSEKLNYNTVYTITRNANDEITDVVADFTVKGFRLPTESEWEFAARGGKNTQNYLYSGSNTPDEVAWYIKNSHNRDHPVGTKIANELGLYDMSGNVYEWCHDWYGSYVSDPDTDPDGPANGIYRIIRGGSAFSDAKYIRIANRAELLPVSEHDNIGFRIVLPDL